VVIFGLESQILPLGGMVRSDISVKDDDGIGWTGVLSFKGNGQREGFIAEATEEVPVPIEEGPLDDASGAWVKGARHEFGDIQTF
jgi:hypothetical protein